MVQDNGGTVSPEPVEKDVNGQVEIKVDKGHIKTGYKSVKNEIQDDLNPNIELKPSDQQSFCCCNPVLKLIVDLLHQHFL